MTAERLDHIEAGKRDDETEAKAMIDDLLLSPVLRSVLCKSTNFSMRSGNPPSSIVAWIDRAELGDFDAFVLGSLLAMQHPGQVIISTPETFTPR
jgi:hypothetical protein